jgi:hypothetical protein
VVVVERPPIPRRDWSVLLVHHRLHPIIQLFGAGGAEKFGGFPHEIPTLHMLFIRLFVSNTRSQPIKARHGRVTRFY